MLLLREGLFAEKVDRHKQGCPCGMCNELGFVFGAHIIINGVGTYATGPTTESAIAAAKFLREKTDGQR